MKFRCLLLLPFWTAALAYAHGPVATSTEAAAGMIAGTCAERDERVKKGGSNAIFTRADRRVSDFAALAILSNCPKRPTAVSRFKP